MTNGTFRFKLHKGDIVIVLLCLVTIAFCSISLTKLKQIESDLKDYYEQYIIRHCYCDNTMDYLYQRNAGGINFEIPNTSKNPQEPGSQLYENPTPGTPGTESGQQDSR